MKFHEAMAALYEGKKVRCKDWPFGDFIDQKGDDTREESPGLYWTKFWNKDWEVYEPPVQAMSMFFSSAARELSLGFRVKRITWENQSLKMNAQGKIELSQIRSPTVEVVQLWNPTIEDLLATDWITLDSTIKNLVNL